MKRYNLLIILLSLVALSCSGSEDFNDIEVDETEMRVEIEGLTASLATKEAEVVTKAVTGFAVNTSLDPTYTMNGREDWLLDIVIYNGNTPTTDGSATFTLPAGSNVWTSNVQIYFPSYLTTRVSAKMYPLLWSDNIATDQNSPEKVLAQDVLIQNGTTTINVAPAHVPNIRMKHAHSMLDFVIYNADESDIASIEVIAGNLTYDPFRVNTTDRIEYMVVLPPGTGNPQVRLTTNQGAKYTQEIEINSSLVNGCYCINLLGLELVLSSVTVSNWTYGEAVVGSYAIESSLPTFLGPPFSTFIITYSNGLTQEVEFNDRGEASVRPAGRVIDTILYNGVSYTDLNITLRDMIIDLNYAIAD